MPVKILETTEKAYFNYFQLNHVNTQVPQLII